MATSNLRIVTEGGSIPSRTDPRHDNPQRPPTPSTGPDLCIDCLEFSAVLAGEYRKKRHTSGLRVVGLDPDEYRNAVTVEWKGVTWSLMLWECRLCAAKWCSYYFFKDIYDGRISDPINSPLELIKRRANIAVDTASSNLSSTSYARSLSADIGLRGQRSFTEPPQILESAPPLLRHNETDEYFPVSTFPESSSVPRHPGSWRTPPTSMAALSPLSESQSLDPESPQLRMHPARVTRRRSSKARSLSSASKHVSDSERWLRSQMLSSAPRVQASSTQDYEARGRSLTPVSLNNFHRRGSNFRLDNYGRIRQLGACSRCKARKKQCSPSHHERQPDGDSEG